MMLVALWLCASRSQSVGQIFTTLLSFDGTDGANSAAGLVRATDGNFYGTNEPGRCQQRWHGLQDQPERSAHHDL